MPIISVVCKTTDEKLDACNLTLDTSTKMWTGVEPGSASDVIKSKTGSFLNIAVPENGTQCRSTTGTIAVFLKNFDAGAVSVGQRGEGHAYERSRPIKWTVI